MLKYIEIKDKTEYLKCCDDTNTSETPTGDCCYDSWKDALLQVSAKLDEANALVKSKEDEHKLAFEWKEKLEVWVKDWDTTDEKADLLHRQISEFIEHLSQICCVTEKTNKAIEILFCMIKDFYHRVDKLKISYDKLMQCIKCLQRPELASGLGIMKVIEEYGKKLDDVIATREALIKKIINVIELAYTLNINICEPDHGLKTILEYWKVLLESKANKCDECCEFYYQIGFPIDKDTYVESLSNDLKTAKDYVETVKKQLDDARNDRNKLQSRKTGLDTAIKEMDATNICKP